MNIKKAGFISEGEKTTVYQMYFLHLIIFLPIIFLNFYKEHYLYTFVLFLFSALFSSAVYSLYKNKNITVSVNLVLFLLVVIEMLAINIHGITIIYWAFPVSILITYIGTPKSAYIFNGLLLSFIAFVSFTQLPLGEAIRAVGALTLTVVITTTLIKQINTLKKKLKHDSITDPMTGAFNRRQLISQLSYSIAHKKRNNDEASILMIDIDFFKNVNDTYGHAIGDKVIKDVSSIIVDSSRKTDVFFRIGGEEFILLVNESQFDNVFIFANKIRKKISSANIIKNHPITISIGIAHATTNITEAQWMKNADTALYKAKTSGRNKVMLFQNE